MVKIASVGIQINNKDIEYIDFSSIKSLSAYNIIIFCPKILVPPPDINSLISHWIEELSKAYNNNKFIFCIVPEYISINRNNNKYNLLNIIPNCSKYIKNIRLSKGNDIISSNNIFNDFRKIFQNHLEYTYILETENCDTILKTNDDDTLGIHYHDKNKNVIITQGFNPSLLYRNKPINHPFNATYEINLKEYNITLDLSLKFKDFLIRLYNTLYKTEQYEKAPDWIINNNDFNISEETEIANQISENNNKIKQLNDTNKELETQKDKVASLKDLLFASNKQLENAVNYALNILGFSPKHYINGEHNLELDTLINYNNLEIIGETKGLSKYADNSHVNQLIANRNQYYHIECKDNQDIPKAILFVNSERQKELSKRIKDNAITKKVLNLAKSNNVSIIWTPDLFFVAQYIKNTNDKSFAKDCRNAIINNQCGFIEFPPILKK